MKFTFFYTDPVGKSAHYHGDKVRILFFSAALLMLVGLPIFQSVIPFGVGFGLGSIVLLVFLAGLTNPREVWISFADTLASLIGVAVFEYFAITNFEISNTFFWMNQLLALIFLVAFYFSTKTLRGFYLRDK